MAEKTRGHDRTRVWTAVLYPESARADWREHLDELHIEWAESPLHEFDTNPTGEVKKAHWHIVLAFDGPKSYEQVCEILAPLNGPIPQKCHSLKGAIRYFAHLDNPEKYQYDAQSVVTNFDVTRYINAYDETQQIVKIVGFIRENPNCTFEQVFDFAVMNGCYSEFRRGAYIINKIMNERIGKS